MLMQFLPFVRMIFIILFSSIIITQVIWPMLRGTKLFPFFRHEHDLENTLVEVRQKNLEKELLEKVRREKNTKN